MSRGAPCPSSRQPVVSSLYLEITNIFIRNMTLLNPLDHQFLVIIKISMLRFVQIVLMDSNIRCQTGSEYQKI